MSNMAAPPQHVAFAEDSSQPDNQVSPDTASIASTSQSSLPYRTRGASNASASDSVLSVASTSSRCPAKRQDELEKHFGTIIERSFSSGNIPPDCLTLLATQSGDLQAKVLLHGRLYLTPYHLCFRSNILGFKTEKIHPLKGITSVRKGTTAKWIQNAVYIIEGNDEEDYTGYGSLGDRDAMYDSIVECWKAVAPERYSTWLDRGSVDTLVDEQATPGEDASAPVEAGHDTEAGATATECTGDGHFDELAIDTTIPIPLEQLFNLVYHNQAFIEDFYKNDKGLTDLQISDWSKEGGNDRRTLSYVMHMNNSIGPSKSDCNGSETVVVANPNKSFEIVSETQTPDIPSGKKFKIRTRTCLSKATIRGNEATKMHCTTQCDWSSGSWLKGTITPAVIKGQKEHHQQLTKKIRQHIKAHPEDFPQNAGDDAGDDADEGEDETDHTDVNEGGDDAVATQDKNIMDHLQDITDNPAMLGIVGLCVLLLLTLLYQWSGRKSPEIIVVAPTVNRAAAY